MSNEIAGALRVLRREAMKTQPELNRVELSTCVVDYAPALAKPEQLVLE